MGNPLLEAEAQERQASQPVVNPLLAAEKATGQTGQHKNPLLAAETVRAAGGESAFNPVTDALGNVLKNTGGAVMGALELLDRPRGALVAGVQALRGARPASDIGEALAGNVHPSWAETLPDMNVPIPSIGAGHRSPVDVDNAGKTANVKNLVGGVADMVADPLNAVGIGVVTKGGKAAKFLSGIAKTYGDDVARQVLAKNADVIKDLVQKGVSPKLIEEAMTATRPLGANLPQRAARGQWAAAKLGPVVTPQKVNVPVAKGLDWARRGLPAVPGLNRLVNYTGYDTFDEGLKQVDLQHRIRQNEIMDVGHDVRKAVDASDFGDMSSAAWHERNGGAWMENLLGGKFGARKASEKQLENFITAMSLSKNTAENKAKLVNKGHNIISDLMKKDFPEFNGVKPYFAPGGSDKTLDEYVLHQIAGKAKDGTVKAPQSGRLASLGFVEDSLTNPDFIFQQKNGNRYWGTLYNVDGKDTLHAVITEIEKNGRIREITQYPITKKGHSVENAIRNKFNDSTLEYISENIKNSGQSGAPLPTPRPDINAQAQAHSAMVNNKLGQSADSVKLGMSQKVTRLNKQQIADMKARGIPIEQIDEAGYGYVPHVETPEEAGTRFWDIRSGRGGPKTRTPQAIHREYVWITDPKTGQEFLDHAGRYAAEHAIDAATLKTRQATVDEINNYLGKNKFRGDLAEATTVGALRNEAAIHGVDQIGHFLREAESVIEGISLEDAAKMGWRTPKINVPERYLKIGDEYKKIKDEITRLQSSMMPPRMARVVESRWKMFAQPERALNEMKKLHNSYMSAWKRYTLFLYPEYHSRNMVGDLWNGWMNGWKAQDMPGDIATATKLQMKQGAGQTVKTALYGNVSGEDIYKAARDHGVIGTGQWSEISDILAPIESAKGKSVLKRVKEQAWDLKGAAAVGEFLENNRRLAFFTRLVKNGDTYEDAAKTVAKSLYDYNDLTDVERNIRRFAIPFYTWYRKNIPAQFANLVRNPGKVAVLPKLKATVEGNNDTVVPEGLRPEWMRRDFSVHTGTDDKGRESFATLGGYLPTTDVFRFGGRPEDVAANVVSNMSPPIKVAAELGLNKNFFRGGDVDRLRDKDSEERSLLDYVWGNERTNFLGQNMPTTVVKLSELLPITRALSTADRMNPFGVFDQYEDKGDGKTRPYHTELDTDQKLTKFLTGLKNYPVDIERDAMYRMKDLQRETENVANVNKTNITAAIRRAIMEGDMESVEKYEALLKQVQEKFEKQQKMLDLYRGSK